MKKYISPAFKSIDLSAESPLMSGSLSQEGDNINGHLSDNTTTGGGLSNRRNSIWGDE